MSPGWQAYLAAYERYLRHERGRAERTVEAYLADARDLAAFCDRFGLSGPDELAPGVLRRWLAQAAEEGVARATIARRVSAARGLFTQLARDGELSGSDPAAALSRPRSHQVLPRVLSADEVARLLDAPDLSQPQGRRDRVLLELLYTGGLRVSEACGARLADLDTVTGTLRLIGKGDREREIPLAGPGLDQLDIWVRHDRPRLASDSDETVLVADRGGPLTPRSARRVVDRLARAVGLGSRSPHALRHAYATHLLEHGADMRSVQELLGHGSLVSTQRYTHLSREHLRSAYEAAHPHA